MTNQIIKIFLASSSELKQDREQFEIFISRKNKEYIKQDIFLELVIWEDFLDAMSQTRLQDEYNKAIRECDVVVSLLKTKVGQYTEEEVMTAYETFKENNKPLIYTYFKEAKINLSQANLDHLQSLQNFKNQLSELGHFYTRYNNIDDLKYKFGEQLNKVISKLMREGINTVPNMSSRKDNGAAGDDLQGSTIYGFAPDSSNSNIVSGQTLQGNTIIGTQNNYGASSFPPASGNAEILELWKEKLATYRREEVIASDPAVKFQLRKQIEECQEKIHELQQQEGKILLNMKQSDYYIERPPIEQLCYQEILQKKGALIRIRASHKMGKSMLMNKVLTFAEKECNYKIAYLDLEEPEFNIVSNLSCLLKYFCQQVSEEVGVPDLTTQHWKKVSGEGEPSQNLICREYFEEHILPNIKTTLVLGLDNVDRLFSEELQLVAADFFIMLRSWYNRGQRKELWEKLKVILVYSTESVPNLADGSPFNVGLENTLFGFNEAQVLSLAKCYDCFLTEASIEVLLEKIGGHPYLINLIFKTLSIDRKNSLEELLDQASKEGGIYRQHFQNYWKHLQEKPFLAKSLYEVVKSDGAISIEPKILYELESLGLISKVGDQISVRCELYKSYFSNHLKILEKIWEEK